MEICWEGPRSLVPMHASFSALEGQSSRPWMAMLLEVLLNLVSAFLALTLKEASANVLEIRATKSSSFMVWRIAAHLDAFPRMPWFKQLKAAKTWVTCAWGIMSLLSTLLATWFLRKSISSVTQIPKPSPRWCSYSFRTQTQLLQWSSFLQTTSCTLAPSCDLAFGANLQLHMRQQWLKGLMFGLPLTVWALDVWCQAALCPSAASTTLTPCQEILWWMV